jgi:hypothetical protein
MIAVFTLNAFLPGMIFLVNKEQLKNAIHKDLKAGILNNENTIIIKVEKSKLAVAGLRWLEEDEFMLNGKMFDVIKHIELKSEIIYYCINDEVEEKLVKTFDERLKKENKDSAGQKQLNDTFCVCTDGLLNLNLLSHNISRFKVNSSKPFKVAFLADTPPPENFLIG